MTATAPRSPAGAAAPGVTVRKAQSHELPALARTLADAFYDDPAGRWFFPRPQTRRRQLERFFHLVALERLAFGHGEVRTSDDLSGAALWMPPGSLESGTLDEILLMPRLLRASGRDVLRALRGMAAMDAVHPHEPHWYLPQVGVATTHQGRGIGAALLRPVLERCDADGMPAYLEATTPRSRDLYARHGFETIAVMTLPDDGPQLWRMWREPGAGYPS